MNQATLNHSSRVFTTTLFHLLISLDSSSSEFQRNCNTHHPMVISNASLFLLVYSPFPFRISLDVLLYNIMHNIQ